MSDKTKRQLVAENEELRRRVSELELSLAGAGPIGQTRAHERLQKVHDRLKDKIQERTAELQNANEELDIFRRFAEASSQGFGMADLDGIVTYMNPALRRTFGVAAPQDAVGKHLSAYYPQEYMRRRETEVLPALLREGHWEGELVISPAGKTTHIFQNSFLIKDKQGAPSRLASVITDITEHKRAEEALQASEEKYKTLVETSPDGVILGDLTGRITFASRRVLEMYGTDRAEDVLGRNPLDFLASQDHPRFLANLRLAAEEGPTGTHEYVFIRKDGTQFAGEILAATIRDRCGKPNALVAILRDVTERKHAQEALERERQALWKMLQASDHERQTIAYNIHDGLTQYLATATMQFQGYNALKGESPDEAQKAFETAVELVRQAYLESRRLVNEVRPPVIDETGLETVVSHLVHEQRRRGGPKIDCRSSVQFGRLPAILQNALYRIVQEALGNACKHSRSEKVKVSMTQEGREVQLEVRDWGVGFNPAAVEKGHFGLEGIRQRVRLLGGQVTIDSTPGSGTLVRVVVPILEENDDE